MTKGCYHCSKLQLLYPERQYYPNDHIKQTCPILAETKCYNCGEVGHTPKYCKLPKIKCMCCGRFGHTVEMCLKEENEMKIPENSDYKNTSWIFMNQLEMTFEI
jgi:hypothetical protein